MTDQEKECRENRGVVSRHCEQISRYPGLHGQCKPSDSPPRAPAAVALNDNLWDRPPSAKFRFRVDIQLGLCFSKLNFSGVPTPNLKTRSVRGCHIYSFHGRIFWESVSNGRN